LNVPEGCGTERSVRIAVLFPSTGLIDGELCDIAEERGAQVLIYKVSPEIVAAPNNPGAVSRMTQEMGSPQLLAEVARQAASVKPDVVVWACTSGSFLGTGSDASRSSTILRPSGNRKYNQTAWAMTSAGKR
jgi:hypothetical protein